MGKVYAAEHVLLRKRQAIKILRGERARVPEIVARFEREAMAAANIEHPNIAGASDFGRLPDGSVYLVLEYVQGKNLRDELDEGAFSIDRSLHIARQIASALASAQELQIVHRDLKPENIMLIEKHGDRDFVKVLDFGIARVPMAETPNQPLTQAGIVFGTPDYMAPEQALGQPVDGRADLFALGVILFEMLAGVRPYDGGASNLPRRMTGHPPRLHERAPGIVVPPAVEKVVEKLLAPNLADRFPSAKQVLVEFSLLIGTPDATGPGPKPVSPTPVSGTPAAARLATFLPGDPLPAFELPLERSEPARPLPEPGGAPREAPELQTVSSELASEAPTLLRAPSVGVEAGGSASSVREHPVLPVRERGVESRSAGLRVRKLAGPLARRAAGLYGQACALVDAHREKLPRFIRRRIKRVSAEALLVTSVGVIVLVAAILVLALSGSGRRGAALSPKSAPSALPVKEASATAKPWSSGSDAGKLVELALARVRENRKADAVALLGRALSADASLASDARVASILTQSLRTNEASVEGAAFVLLQGPMGSQGANILYESSLDRTLPAGVRARADAWLASKAFEKASSPELYSAVKLRQASSCEQKHHLLLLAGNVGGQRTLEVLRELEKRVECRPSAGKECFPCLAKDERLKQTILRVEERLKR